jgi:hypothetical protein
MIYIGLMKEQEETLEADRGKHIAKLELLFGLGVDQLKELIMSLHAERIIFLETCR